MIYVAFSHAGVSVPINGSVWAGRDDGGLMNSLSSDTYILGAVNITG